VNPQPIDMTGQTIAGYVVVEQGPSRTGRGAHWWCMCMGCREQVLIRGSKLRKLALGQWRWHCRACEAKAGAAP
jgi:hypothetical protein